MENANAIQEHFDNPHRKNMVEAPYVIFSIPIFPAPRVSKDVDYQAAG